jgi:hypothetical protein
MIYEIKIKNRGVSARRGIVRLIGEVFRAFVYRIIAVISKGRAIKVADQKVLSRSGMSMSIRMTRNTGKVNINLIHATKYSSLDTNTRLVRASLVASRIAVKRA